MADIFKSATLEKTGHVHVVREVDGKKWRGAIEPHDMDGLNEYASELPQAERDQITTRWAEIPLPSPPPPNPPRVVPDAFKDVPASANSVPALRAAINELKAHFRGE